MATMYHRYKNKCIRSGINQQYIIITNTLVLFDMIVTHERSPQFNFTISGIFYINPP